MIFINANTVQAAKMNEIWSYSNVWSVQFYSSQIKNLTTLRHTIVNLEGMRTNCTKDNAKKIQYD